MKFMEMLAKEFDVEAPKELYYSIEVEAAGGRIELCGNLDNMEAQKVWNALTSAPEKFVFHPATIYMLCEDVVVETAEIR